MNEHARTEDLRFSPEVDKLFAALVAVAKVIENPKKRADNPHFKSKYADLAEVLDVARPVLAEHGIAVIQAPCEMEGNTLRLVSRLIHVSGQWVESTCSTLIDSNQRNAAQAVGSAITYLRRYSLQALVNIAPEGEDDDGNATGSAEGAQQTRAQSGSAKRRGGDQQKGQETDTTGWPPPGWRGFPGLVVEQARAAIPNDGGTGITAAQQKRLWAIAGKGGWSRDHVRDILLTIGGWESTNVIPWQSYAVICTALERYQPHDNGAFDPDDDALMGGEE